MDCDFDKVYVVFKNDRLVKCFRDESKASEYIEQLTKGYVERGAIAMSGQSNFVILKRNSGLIKLFYECFNLE